MEFILIFLVAGIMFILWRSKMSKNTIAIETLVTERSEKKFRAVRVKPCDDSCEPAKWVSQKVYLVKELSRLPLESCDRFLECECKFSQYEDRRQNEDRRSDSTILQNVFDGTNNRKREKKGRRNED